MNGIQLTNTAGTNQASKMKRIEKCARSYICLPDFINEHLIIIGGAQILLITASKATDQCKRTNI